MSTEQPHYRVFNPTDPCPFEDCRHHRWCAGAWNFNHVEGVYPPEGTLEHLGILSGASHTGQTGIGAMWICKSWEPLEPGGSDDGQAYNTEETGRP